MRPPAVLPVGQSHKYRQTYSVFIRAAALAKIGKTFLSENQNQRGALTLLDGILYVPYGGAPMLHAGYVLRPSRSVSLRMLLHTEATSVCAKAVQHESLLFHDEVCCHRIVDTVIKVGLRTSRG